MDTTPPASPEPTPPTPPTPASPVPTPPPSADEKQWKVIMHASAFSGLLVPAGNILGPLIIWMVKKTELPGLDPEARKVLNFHISYTIYMIAAFIIAFVGSCLVVPIFLPVALGIAYLVLTIIGCVKVSNNEAYEFPVTIKML